MTAFKTVALLSAAAVVTTDKQFSTGSVADALKMRKLDATLGKIFGYVKGVACNTDLRTVEGEVDKYFLLSNRKQSKTMTNLAVCHLTKGIIFQIKKTNNNWSITCNNTTMEKKSQNQIKITTQLLAGFITGSNGQMILTDKDLKFALTNSFGKEIIGASANKVSKSVKRFLGNFLKKYVEPCVKGTKKVIKNTLKRKQKAENGELQTVMEEEVKEDEEEEADAQQEQQKQTTQQICEALKNSSKPSKVKQFLRMSQSKY